METNPAWSIWEPMEFQFTEPEDVKAYGDRWYSYSEPALIRRPARELLQLEAHLGLPLVDVMNGMRVSATIGTLAAAWIGVRDFDVKLAGDFDDFNPLTLTITWRLAVVDEGKDESTDTPPPPDAGPPPDTSAPGTSDLKDIVTLPTLPTAE